MGQKILPNLEAFSGTEGVQYDHEAPSVKEEPFGKFEVILVRSIDTYAKKGANRMR